MKKQVPDLTIRSTFIVASPARRKRNFQLLLDWLTEAELDRVGAFKYEPVTGADSNKIEPHVAPEVMDERYDAHDPCSRASATPQTQKPKSARTIPVIIDDMGTDGFKGRSQGDAPNRRVGYVKRQGPEAGRYREREDHEIDGV